MKDQWNVLHSVTALGDRKPAEAAGWLQTHEANLAQHDGLADALYFGKTKEQLFTDR